MEVTSQLCVLRPVLPPGMKATVTHRTGGHLRHGLGSINMETMRKLLSAVNDCRTSNPEFD